MVVRNRKPRLHMHRPNSVQCEFLSILAHCRLSKQRTRNAFCRGRLVVGVGDHGHQRNIVVVVGIADVDVVVVILVVVSLDSSSDDSEIPKDVSSKHDFLRISHTWCF